MLKEVKSVYFSGINGIGMSGLAKILCKQGYTVYGSDLEIKPVTEDMQEMCAFVPRKNIILWQNT